MTWLLAIAACSGSTAPARPESIRVEVTPATTAAPAAPRVGEGLPPQSAEIPDVPQLPLFLTVHAPPADCDPGPVVAELGAGCAALPIVAVRTSGNTAGAQRAVDGDTCSNWNSGGPPPAAFSLEMPDGASVAGLVLVAEATPLYPLVTHVVETSDDGERFVPAFRLRGITNTEIPFSVVFPTPIHRRHIRVRTVSSPSWTAWREIVPFACDGPATAPAHAIPALQEVPAPAPTPAASAAPAQTATPDTPRRAIGTGRCRRNADCAFDQCCQPEQCIPRARAPRCEHVGCPAVVGPLDGSRCVCHEGTCAAEWRPPPRAVRLND